MIRRLIATTIALATLAAPIASQAYGNGTGFKTGSCEYPAGTPLPGSGALLEVGNGGYASIQSAVDDASEGDTILIHPGIYYEKVVVATPGLRIRGTDRDQVILDGEFTKNFGFDVNADRVVLENMTGRNYRDTAFWWLSVTGYWGRYLTAYNNGRYGVYAYDARCGQMDNSYASGNADSGFYIGECYPCDAVITDVEAAENALGYSGTNAGGNLLLKDSSWHDNALGIVPNSLDGEAGPPQRGVTIENNTIIDNSRIDAPGVGIAALFYGVGIAIAGGSSNHVIGNEIRGHEMAGIVLAPLPDQFLYVPAGNTIWGNTVSDSGLADLAQGASSGPGNCWDHNTYESTAPELLETVWGCTNNDPDTPKLPFYSGITPPGGDPRVEVGLIEGFAGVNGRVVSDWKTWPAPTCASAASSCVDMPHGLGAVEAWLPALL
ncbi:MAG TPA: right-handed parallel beta-helix repeat-containing protein [Actinomycetota bacterium]